MPKPSKLARRERGFTQVELAEKTGLVQTLVSGYERGKRGRRRRQAPVRKASRRVLQRLERIEALPAHVQTTMLKSLDLMWKNVAPPGQAPGGLALVIADDRQHAHALLDRIPAGEITAAVRFLEFLLLDPVSRASATAPVKDEEISEDEEPAVARSKEWFKHHQGIPFKW